MARTQAKGIVGFDAPFTLIPESGGPEVTLWNSDWEIEPTNEVAEAPNTTDGMTRCAGLDDWSGSVTGKTNVLAGAATIENSVRVGKIYQFRAYRSKATNQFFTGYLIVGKGLKIKTGTGTVEEWTFPFMKAYGDLIKPDGSIY